MTFGGKLAKLRKENNLTQEQLADILSVSRQSVSKWESDLAYPETEKLIRLSELFHCSLDYLIKDAPQSAEENISSFTPLPRFFNLLKERKSERTLWGMPLWHIGKNAHGVIAVGWKARGIVAIGAAARGIVSIGFLSLGVFSFGMVSIGVLSIALLALGLIAAGTFSAGIFSAGAISLGLISCGAIAVGDFSFGALAFGKYWAMGDTARGMIALGASEATGELVQHCGGVSPSEMKEYLRLLKEIVPAHLAWAAKWISRFL